MWAPSSSCTFGPLVQSPVLLASLLLQSDQSWKFVAAGPVSE